MPVIINNFENFERIYTIDNTNISRVLFPEKDELDKQDKLNKKIDLSNIIFDIKERLTDIEYKTIMELIDRI